MHNDTTSHSDDETTLEPRTRRARTEDMEVASRKAGGIYSVRVQSGTVFCVDITTEA